MESSSICLVATSCAQRSPTGEKRRKINIIEGKSLLFLTYISIGELGQKFNLYLLLSYLLALIFRAINIGNLGVFRSIVSNYL